MRHFVSAAAMVWLSFAAVAEAQEASAVSEPVVVVELFTSQGCSSCPPADALFAQLADDPRVLPLALHVDYWDYIGWQDQFAQSQFTARQKAYARAIGSRMIYTPQFIIGGQDRVEGNQPDQIETLIRRNLDKGSADHNVTLAVQRKGGALRIRAATAKAITGPVLVQLVHYRPEETVVIESGENAGLTVTYRNIVTQWQNVGEWSGDTPFSLDIASPAGDPAVVILQAPGMAEIIAAARIE